MILLCPVYKVEYNKEDYLLLEKIDSVKFHNLYEFILNYQAVTANYLLKVFNDNVFIEIMCKCLKK